MRSEPYPEQGSTDVNPDKSSRQPHVVALLLATALILVGFVVVKDFGVSTDEYVQKLYAQQTIQSYLGQFDPRATVADLRFYGPFFSVLSLIGTRFLTTLPLGLERFQAAHFTYFLSYVLGCVSVYYLLLLFVRWPAALVGSIFFASQPLLLGHAFINPKDTPMLGFFTASMALGIYAVRALRAVPDPTRSSPVDAHRSEAAPRGRRHSATPIWLVLGILSAALIASVVDLMVTHWSLPASVGALRSAYEGGGPGFLSALFHFVAQDAAKTPLAAYLAKWLVAYVVLASVWIVLLALGVIWAAVKARLGMGLPALVRRQRGWALLVVAAALWGMAISIRIGALFAGGLVACLLVWTLGVRGLVPAMIYGLVAAGVSVATWPYLWGQPLARAWDSLQVMMTFPHETSILYRGISFKSTGLPPDYVAGLMVIQFTLPLLPLAAIGLVRARSWFGNRSPNRQVLWVLGAWILVPLAAFVAFRPTLYGTFRQLLFVTPPLFVFAGLGIEWLWRWLSWTPLQGLLAGLILVPGIVGIVRLHPYEYVYYNALVGGTGGAYQRFEMDYWCTSLREATRDVNQIAQQKDEVAVLFRDTSQVAPFARPDLHVVHARTVNDVLATHPDKVLVCSPAFNFRHADEWATLAQVGREGAIFSKVMRGPSQ